MGHRVGKGQRVSRGRVQAAVLGQRRVDILGQSLAGPEQAQAETHVADDVERPRHGVLLERVDGLGPARLRALRADPHVEQPLRLVDGFGKGVCRVLLVKAGAGNLAVQAPQGTLGGEDTLAEHVEDAVLGDVLGEGLAALCDLVDHLGALGIHQEVAGRYDEEGFGPQPVKVCLVGVVGPVGVHDTGEACQQWSPAKRYRGRLCLQ